MFFNFYSHCLKLKKICLVLSLLGLASCSNEEKKETGLAVQLSYDTKCLDGFGERLAAWSKGQGEADVLKTDFNCVSDGIQYFLLRVRGRDSSSYTRTEVFHIMQKFFGSKEFTQQSVNDILEAKTWLLGGSRFFITRAELERVSTLLDEFIPVLSKLTPMAHRLFFNEAKEALNTQELSLEEATQIRSHLGRLLELIERFGQEDVTPMTYESVHRVLHSLADQLDFNVSLSESDFKKIWSVINIILGQDLEASIRLAPYSKLYTYLEKVYFLSLRLKYGVLDVGWRNPINYRHLEPIIEELLPFVEELITNQPEAVLSRKRLLEALTSVSELLNLEQELNSEIRHMLVDRIYTRLFNVDQNLDALSFKKLKSEWDEFRNFQNNTEVFYGQRFDGSLVDQLLVASLSEQNRQSLDFLWPMLSDSQGYVLTDLQPRTIEANYGNLFKLNWQRALSRVFLSMYTEDPVRRLNLTGVTISELQNGYSDVHKLLSSFDILSESDSEGWFRIFNEANLFVPRANPDEYLDFVEGVDYFAILFSGLEFSGHLFDEVKKDCPMEKKSCEMEWLKKSPQSFWSPLIPQFGNYLRADLSDSEWKEWAEGMEEMARQTPQPQAFERSEFLYIAIASQYIEGFLRKYDQDKDEMIDFAETVASFDDFKDALLSLPQIQGTAAEDDPQTLLAVYSFFLRQGRLPNEIFGQPIELLGWLRRVQRCTTIDDSGRIELNSNAKNCAYKSSRSKLMKILAFLSNAI